MSDEKRNPYGAEDTGHEWDGIRELKNDPPRWWMITFYLSAVWLVGYFVLYPAIPLVNDYTRGLLGYTQIDEYKEGLKEIEKVREPFEKKVAGMSASGILDDAEMRGYAMASTKALFGDKCAACHGSGGQGTPGFPVLADDNWLYGGTVDAIEESINWGREGMMPGFDGLLTEQELDDVVTYVRQLPEGKVHQPGRKVFMGETGSEATCWTCHGEDAKGVTAMGSANLTDNIWRFDGSEDGVRRTILHGVNTGEAGARDAVMPAWEEKLSESEIKKLAVRVWMLGGGKEEPQE